MRARTKTQGPTHRSTRARKRARIRTALIACAAVGAVAAFLPEFAPAHAADAKAGAGASDNSRSVPTIPLSASRGLHTDAATCWYGSCYDYVSGRQTTDATGASVTMAQADPETDPGYSGAHSLQELSLQDSAQKSTVEVGWTVDKGLNGDTKPHLFVYHWVDGKESCYNGCGFVQVSGSAKPGMEVTGKTGRFGIDYADGKWWISYNDEKVGYFPGSLWNGSYTKAQLISAFGEVAESASPSCTDMGNGVAGSKSGSSTISDYKLEGTSDAPSLSVTDTSPENYDHAQSSPTSFQLGGAGGGDC